MSSRVVEVIPTCVPKNAEDLKSFVEHIQSFSNAAHIDIDDGIFTPACSWPYIASGVFAGVELPTRDMRFDVHLMVKDPHVIGTQFARAGAHTLIVHVEVFASPEDARTTCTAWREAGIQRIGLALLMGTPIESIRTLVSLSDFLHLLSVAQIGAQGAPYEDVIVKRIQDTHLQYPGIAIEIDGGINQVNAAALITAGASYLAVGSSILKSKNPKDAYLRIKDAAESALQ